MGERNLAINQQQFHQLQNYLCHWHGHPWSSSSIVVTKCRTIFIYKVKGGQGFLQTFYYFLIKKYKENEDKTKSIAHLVVYHFSIIFGAHLPF